LNSELFVLFLKGSGIGGITVVLERNWLCSESLNIESESHGNALVFVLGVGQGDLIFERKGYWGRGR
jgi:hypothetical protein